MKTEKKQALCQLAFLFHSRRFHTCIIKTELKAEIDFLMDNYNAMVEGSMNVRQAW